jgi:hypothetical protein
MIPSLAVLLLFGAVNEPRVSAVDEVQREAPHARFHRMRKRAVRVTFVLPSVDAIVSR